MFNSKINTMKRTLMLMMALLVVSVGIATAQTLTVTGTVVSERDGQPVAGAYVLVNGTTLGTITNANGEFGIREVPADAKEIIVTFLGMSTASAPVQAEPLRVVMHEDATFLEETIVVAYGTADKRSFTGSAEVIKADKLEKRTVSNVTKALDGLSTGVITTSGSGQPGAGASVVIRGFGSLNASTTPLYVVDGIPYDGNINAINPNDIESMTIIKDASAGALYGARGANGVVMINTKRGKEGALNVQFKGTWSVASRAIPRYETMDAYAWTEDLYSMYYNTGRSKGLVGDAISAYAVDQMINGTDAVFGAAGEYNPFSRDLADLIDPATGKIKEGTTLKWNEDWLDESTAKNPLRQEYVLSVNGGSSKTKYMFSLGYLDQEGLIKSTNFRRYSGRANVDTKVNDWLKTGLNMNFANNTTNSTTLGTSASSSSAYSNVFYSCANMAPIYPVYLKDAEGKTVYENGNAVYDWGDYRPAGANAGWNPIANLYEDKYLGVSDNLSARTYIDLGGLKTGPLQGLKLSANFGFDYVNSRSTTYYNPNFGNGETLRGLLDESTARYFSYTFNQLLTYNRKFGDHSVDFLAGHEFYSYNAKVLGATKSGSAGDNLYELDGFVTNYGISGYSQDYRVDSYLTRFNYGYADKYYASASYRRDASSRFHQDNRWGDFWSVGASWRISQENFLKDVKWVNNLTLKASYGVQGNDSIGSLYAWQQLYSLAYPNGGMGGALISKLETKDLRWEKNKNLNVGVEASLFDRLNVSAEYYSKKTEDMLMDYPMAVSLGFSGYNKNVGSMLNTGFEFTVSGDVFVRPNFMWTATVMGSTVNNKVLKLTENGTPIKSGNYIIEEGSPVNSFYLVNSAGVNPANGDKLYYIWSDDPETGERVYSVTNNPSKATAYRETCGSRIPDLYGSISNDFKFWNFDVNLLCTYSIGGKILDATYYGYLYNTYVGTAAHVDRARAWKNPGDVTDIPRVDIGGATNILYTQDDLVSASYFAIKSFTLGYTLPEKWMKAVKMNSVRVYVAGDNLLMFSARKGLDPQYNFSGSTAYSYTPERTVSLGVEVNF